MRSEHLTVDGAALAESLPSPELPSKKGKRRLEFQPPFSFVVAVEIKP
jgi:hypothetical protein